MKIDPSILSTVLNVGLQIVSHLNQESDNKSKEEGRMKMNFESKDLLEFLTNFEEYSKKEVMKVFKRLLKNEGFKEWLFYPKEKNPNLEAVIEKMYTGLAKPQILKAIIAAVEDEGYNEFDRTAATFLFSISNVAKEVAVDRDQDILEKKRSGALSGSAYSKQKENLESYVEIAKRLEKTAKMIVKSSAKKMAHECKMPKKLCLLSLHNVPAVEYIDKYKIGVYLNNLLVQIYTFVDDNNTDFVSIFTGNEINYNWERYFKELFGKNNTIEVSTFILLEGVSRIGKYDSAAVHECWESLTEFALDSLNKAPEALRDQMIELYIKRIDKMFANKSFDLRANLLAIDDSDFPHLSKSIEKYRGRIEPIIMRKK